MKNIAHKTNASLLTLSIVLSIIFPLLSFPQKAQAAIGDYTGTSFSVANGATDDIAWDGTYFWTTDDSINEALERYNANGTHSATFLIDTDATQLHNPTGITWDGTYLWVTNDGGGNVYRFTSGGAYDNFIIDTSVHGNSSPYGITWDGTYLWTTDDGDARVYSFTTGGEYTGVSFSTAESGNTRPTGIEWDGEHFWVGDEYDGLIYRYDADGNYVDSFDITADIPFGREYPIGFAWDGTYLWVSVAGNNTNQAYRYEGRSGTWLATYRPPSAPTLYSSDGSTEIAFNNSRQNTTSPTFRLSATHTESFNRFQIQMATTTDFSSTIYSQTFSSTYTSGTAYNLTVDSLSPSLPTTDDTTYYVRARASADGGTTWGGWSSASNNPLWSFTYESTDQDPDWYQTVITQLTAGTIENAFGTTTSGAQGLAPAGLNLVYVGHAYATGNDLDYILDLSNLTGGVDTTLRQGDLVLLAAAMHDTENENPGVEVPTGYTELFDLYVSDSNDTNFSVSWKIMGETPDTFVSCLGIRDLDETDGNACVAYVWRNADAGNPIDVESTSQFALNTAVVDSPAITPVTQGAVVITAGAGASDSGDTSVTAPSGYGNVVSVMGDNGSDINLVLASKAWSGSGAEDPGAWTDWTVNSADSSYSASMALRPNTTLIGSATSTAIEFDTVPGTSDWSEVTVNGDVTYGSIVVRVLDADQSPLSGYSCTISSGSCTIDLSGLDPLSNPDHATIYLQAAFTYSGGAPILHDWGVSWAVPVDLSVSSDVATNVSFSGATLNGTILNTGGETGAGTGHGFAYGTSTTLTGPNVATTSLGTYSGTGTFSKNISGLAGNTTYYFRAYAANSTGTTTDGIRSFTTSGPSVTTNAATNVATSTATLNGNITSLGTNGLSLQLTAPTYTGGADSGGLSNSGTGSSNVVDVVVSGNYAYALTVGNSTACSSTASNDNGCELKVFDISNPAAPTYVGGADASGSTNSGTASLSGFRIAVSGNYVYTTWDADATTCSGTAGSAIGCEFKIFDVSTPSSPTYAAGADRSGAINSGADAGAHEGVAVSGNYAYVLSGANGTACSQSAGSARGCELKIFNISNPSSPTYAAGLDADGSTTGTRLLYAIDVAISGDYAYILWSNGTSACSQTIDSTNYGCELKVYDISTPTSPTYVGGADADGATNSGVNFWTGREIAISGNYAYTLWSGNGTTCSGTAGSAIGCELKVFDISTPSTPTYVGGVDASGRTNTGTDLVDALSIEISGDYAYTIWNGITGTCSEAVGSALGCELKVFDISTPSTPTYVGGTDASGSSNSGSSGVVADSVAVSGDYAYTTSNGNATTCSGTAGSAQGCEFKAWQIIQDLTTNHGFAYGTSTDLTGPNVATTSLGTYSATGAFEADLANLEGGTTYYYRAYASNSIGTSTGEIVSFSTGGAPVVTTSAATAVTGTTATLNGSITNTGGHTDGGTQHGFVWGTEAALSGGDTATTTLGTYSGAGSFEEGVSSLQPGTTYYFQAYAANTYGTSTGEILSFTPIAAPTVTSNSATSIDAAIATLNGTITATGGESATVRGFAWGTNAALSGGDTATTTGNGSFSTGAFAHNLTDLTAETTYYFRAYAVNSIGTSTGAILSFATLADAGAAVTTNDVSGVGYESATLNATITETGGETGAGTQHGFAWGTNALLSGGDTATTTLGDVSGTGAFNQTIEDLESLTMYYVRAYVTNSEGTVYGDVVSFTTERYIGGGSSLDAAPASIGVVSGGDESGSGGGESIGSEIDFVAPSGGTAVSGGGLSSASGAYSSDGSYASANASAASDFSTYNFGIPGSNTITGIAVKLEASANQAGGTFGVELSWDGGSTITSSSKATSALTTSDVVYTLGGSSDTWGRTWSPSEFANANFRVRITGNPSSNTVRLDAIQVRIYHQATGGGGSGGGGEI